MLVQGRDFNCKAAYCTGIGSVDGTFRQLQRTINATAGTIPIKGFRALSIDGRLGNDTLVGLRAIMERRTGPFMAYVCNAPNPQIAVAVYADGLIGELTALATFSAGAPDTPTPCAPAPADIPEPGPPVTVTPLPSLPGIPASPTQNWAKTNRSTIVLLGAGAVGLGLLVTMFVSNPEVG